MFSQAANYYRKVSLSIILINLGLLIIMQFLQLTKDCRKLETGANKELLIESRLVPITLNNGRYIANGIYKVSLTRGGAEKLAKLDLDRVAAIKVKGEVQQVTGFSRIISTNDQPNNHNIYNNSIDNSANSVEGKALIDGLYCEIRLINAEISDHRPSGAWGFSSIRKISAKFLELQAIFVNKMSRYLPEPHSALASGVLLGADHSLPDEFYQQLIYTGTIHVVAASGYNISIIIGILALISSRYVKRQLSVVICLVGISCYVLLAGGSPSVVRAGLMGGLLIISQSLGRVYLASWGLIISSLILLLFSPLLLMSISFQLSVSATAGLIWILPNIYRPSSQLHTTNWSKISEALKGAFWTTTAANLMTLPLILMWFGRLSLISFLANTFVLWLIPIIMFVSAGLLLGTWLPFWIGQILALPVWLFTELFVKLISIFSKIPGGDITIHLPFWCVPIWWLVLVCVVNWRRKWQSG